MVEDDVVINCVPQKQLFETQLHNDDDDDNHNDNNNDDD